MKVMFANKSGRALWVSFGYMIELAARGPQQNLVVLVTTREVTQDVLGERGRLLSSSPLGDNGLLRKHDVPDSPGPPTMMQDGETQGLGFKTERGVDEGEEYLTCVISEGGASTFRDGRPGRGVTEVPVDDDHDDDLTAHGPPYGLIVTNKLDLAVHVAVCVGGLDIDTQSVGAIDPDMPKMLVVLLTPRRFPKEKFEGMKVLAQSVIEPGKKFGRTKLPVTDGLLVGDPQGLYVIRTWTQPSSKGVILNSVIERLLDE